MGINSKILGNVIRKLRKERGLSQESLALLSGTHRTYIAQRGGGDASASINILFNISKALGLKLSELTYLYERENDQST